jgi:hypothetical protein
MSLDSVTQAVRSKAATSPALGYRIQFDLGDDGIVFRDGTQTPAIAAEQCCALPKCRSCPRRRTPCSAGRWPISATPSRHWPGGVKFVVYPAMTRDEFGIWTAPRGARIAWFKDPDGNTLSLTEIPPLA